MDSGEIVPFQLIGACHPFREPLYFKLFFSRLKAPASRSFCLYRDRVAVVQTGLRYDLKPGLIGILRGSAVGNLQFCPAFARHTGKLKAHSSERIGCAGKDELVHRRTGNECIDQAYSCDYAKSDKPAPETALALSVSLQVPDLLLGAGLRYTPLI